MFRLGRFRRRERGATAALVAIIMVPLAVGSAMISVDVGQLLWERREVQNAADATVRSAAWDCAKANACNPVTTTPGLVALANDNARDGKNTIASFCAGPYLITKGLTSLAGCAAPVNPALVDCPTVDPQYANYPFIEARTKTQTQNGASAISSKLASVIAGQPVATTVDACARAVWGGLIQPPPGPIMPIAISYCEWAAATGADPLTGKGGTYYPGPSGAYPGYDPVTNPWPTGPEKEILTAKTTSSPGCTDFNGHVAPGAFSALAQSGTCEASQSSWIQGDPGNDAVCDDTLLQSKYRGRESLIPLFNCVSLTQDLAACLSPADVKQAAAQGKKLQYHIVGYASFYLSAWKFSGTANDYSQSLRPPRPYVCTAGNERCLSGWFTKEVVLGGKIAPPGAITFGPQVVLPAG